MGVQQNDDDLGDTAAALALLSPEERAAMLDSDEDAAITAELAKGAEDDDKTPVDDKTPKNQGDDDDDDDGDDDDMDEDEQDDTPVSKVDDKSGANDEVAEANATIAAEVQLDLSHVEKGHQDKLDALDATKAEAFQKLMDGEIDAKEYSQIESQYLRDRDALADEKSSTTAWFKEVHDFKNNALKEGVDYHRDPEKATAWDDWVKRLAANPKHADKDGSWFLQEAHKKVKLEFGIDAAQSSDAKSQQLHQNNVAKPKGRAPKLDNIPPTLGNLPAAADDDAGDGGEFAHLDKLDGMALERELAKMTPEQQDRYLRS